MGLKTIFTESTIAKYVRKIRESPSQLIANYHLLSTVTYYALCGFPLAWDQASSGVVPSLPGFKNTFRISSATNAKDISNFVSFVYIGAGVGAGLAYFFNDRIGRRWSTRLYMTVWMVGQLIATFSEGSLGALYTARIISGLGIGATTVIGPVGVVETAPVEFRGLIGAWFNLYMLMGGFVSTFTTLGVYLHVPEGRLQYQIVFFVPIIFSGFHTALSFFVCESPRWLYLSDKHEECIETLQKLRGLPLEDARVQTELKELQRSVQRQRSIGPGIVAAVRQTFLVPSNLRRVQQVVFAYALAQLSGANNITSYLMPILKMIGTGGGPDRSMFISGMYGVSKFFFCMMTSFFFIDALGRRKSMIFGITVQMISDIYIAVFIKCRQDGPTPSASAGKAAIAMIFVHGFGYATGLLVLPYVFGAELWPDEIRSFGASFGQLFHWFFYYGLNQGLPSLLSETHNWGAFVFFAAWCFIAGIYTFFVIPETAGRSFEEMEYLFEQPIYKAYRTSKQLEKSCSTSSDMERGVEVDEITDASSSSSGGHEARKGAAIIISQC